MSLNKHSYRFLALTAIVLLLGSYAVLPTAQAATMLKAQVCEEHAQVVSAQNAALGFAVKLVSGKKVISVVKLGSSALYNGLKEGDILVAESISEGNNRLDALVKFSRNGSTYQVSLTAYGDWHRFLDHPLAETSMPPPAPDWERGRSRPLVSESVVSDGDFAGAPPFTQTALAEGQSQRDSFQLNVQQQDRLIAKRALQGRDMVVLIDRSGSMSTSDCPQALSRWDWCKQQVMNLSNDVVGVLPKGFTLVLFNNHQKATANADVGSIAQAFETNKPDGGTDTASAVATQIKAYQDRKTNGSQKPLVLVVITDGEPNDPNALRNTLITAANDITTRDEISVVFIEVGEDNQATAYLEDLDRSLNQEGGKFNIVHSVIFPDVAQLGLLRALARSLTQ